MECLKDTFEVHKITCELLSIYEARHKNRPWYGYAYVYHIHMVKLNGRCILHFLDCECFGTDIYVYVYILLYT